MRGNAGFSLLELIVAMAIVAILLAVGLPSYRTYTENTRIRTVAQSFLSGLQKARSEAVSRNTNIDFSLTNDAAPSLTSATIATGGGWLVRTSDGVTFIEGKPQSESGGRVGGSAIAVNDLNNDGAADAGAVDTVTFTGLGQTSLGGNTVFTFSNPSAGNCVNAATPGPMRCLNIVVTRGGQAKICDPAVLTASDTRSCS